ncbi:1110_t:CDS:2 [Ambispora gerdemannii]|uniref:1110_t:CDS:1 n=1 Tax=Ambispora gerdemannii TaxID=144530 RepID=A0A9N8ZLV9_9GLOM|nr:1110_t:CDS:2 [Ambispora gerdemannii]
MGEFMNFLSRDFSRLLEKSDNFDVSIEIGVEPDKKVFKAHSVILRARSSYFDRALSSKWAQVEDGSIKFKKTDISPAVFSVILNYLYGGKISLDQYSASLILEMLVAADEFNLEDIFEHIQKYLINNRRAWLQQNLAHAHRIALEHSSFNKLQTFCMDILLKEPEKVFQSKDFGLLREEILLRLLEIDEIRMEEFDIWNLVIDWGRIHNPNLPDDVADWSDEQSEAMKNTLARALPLIRYFEISSEQFSEFVLPYQQILPNHLAHSIIRYHLAPNQPLAENIMPARRGNINSKIISSKQAALIASWINRNRELPAFGWRPYAASENPYEFKLLMRGSQDGFTGQHFHSRCDNKGATVTIAKVKDTHEILGGYNPLNWLCDGKYQSTTNSFIFSFINRNAVVSRVSNQYQSYAIYCCTDNGPRFGNDLAFNGDFKNQQSSYCVQNYYELSVRPTASSNNFSVDEFEVFQIVKKQLVNI